MINKKPRAFVYSGSRATTLFVAKQAWCARIIQKRESFIYARKQRERQTVACLPQENFEDRAQGEIVPLQDSVNRLLHFLVSFCFNFKVHRFVFVDECSVLNTCSQIPRHNMAVEDWTRQWSERRFLGDSSHPWCPFGLIFIKWSWNLLVMFLHYFGARSWVYSNENRTCQWAKIAHVFNVQSTHVWLGLLCSESTKPHAGKSPKILKIPVWFSLQFPVVSVKTLVISNPVRAGVMSGCLWLNRAFKTQHHLVSFGDSLHESCCLVNSGAALL